MTFSLTLDQTMPGTFALPKRTQHSLRAMQQRIRVNDQSDGVPERSG
jgi:hypothetical protein